MPHRPEILVDPFLTNTTPIVAKSKVVELSNGNILVTYISELGGPSGKDGFFVHGQQFDALGNKIGGEVLFEFPVETDTENFDIVALPAGRVAVLADQDGGSRINPDRDDPFVGVFQLNDAGTATFLPEESEFVEGTGGRHFDFALTERGDDGWMAHSLSTSAGADALFQDSDIQDIKRVEKTGFRGTRNGELESTTLENGTQVLLLDRDARESRAGDLEFRIIGLDGNVVKSGLVGGDADDRNNEGTVQALKGGGFVIAWTERDADTDVVFKMFDASGSALRSSVKFVANKGPTGDNNNEPAIAALQDGGFIIFFDDDTSGGGIKGQRYDDQGGKVGEIFTVFPFAFPDEIDATLLSNGNVVVSFTLFNTIHTTIVSVDGDVPDDVPDGAIVGTDGDDTLDGTGGDDVISGLAGDDKINGGSGNDSILGGNGADVINGGQNNDAIDGQGNNDTIDGNGGNDRIDGGGGADEIFGGAGNDVLNGGAGDNSLTGGSGNDIFVFAGNFGDDTIIGFGARNNREKIDMSQVAGIEDFEDLASNALTQRGDDVVIDINGGTINPAERQSRRSRRQRLPVLTAGYRSNPHTPTTRQGTAPPARPTGD